MERLAKWIYIIFGKVFDKEKTNRFAWMYFPFIVVFSVILSLTATVKMSTFGIHRLEWLMVRT